jgi:hypothetical protein
VENKKGTRREKERERVVDGERKGCAKNKKRERKRKRSSESEWKTQKRTCEYNWFSILIFLLHIYI